MSDTRGPRNRKPVPTSGGNAEKARQGMLSNLHYFKNPSILSIISNLKLILTFYSHVHQIKKG